MKALLYEEIEIISLHNEIDELRKQQADLSYLHLLAISRKLDKILEKYNKFTAANKIENNER